MQLYHKLPGRNHDKSQAMDRSLKTGTNLRDAKKKYADKLPQISKVPARKSFCLYLKISALSFMNKALKIKPSIYWGRLPYPTPLGASCSINCIYHPVNVLVNFSTFLSDAHVSFLIRQKHVRFCAFFLSLTVQKRSISLSHQLNQQIDYPTMIHNCNGKTK